MRHCIWTAFFALCFGLCANARAGEVYVASFFDSALYKLDAVTGAVLQTYIAPNSQATLQVPGGLTVGPDGNLYFCSTFNNSIAKYDLTSNTLSTFINSAELNNIGSTVGIFNFNPSGLRFGPDGNLYVSLNGGMSQTSGGVIRFNITNGLAYAGTFDVIATGINQPNNLTFGRFVGDTDSLYVAGVQGIYKITAATSSTPNTSIFVAAGANGLINPSSVLWGADGKLYVVDIGTGDFVGGDGQVLRYNSNGSFDTRYTPSNLPNGLSSSDAIFLDDGRLLVANRGPSYPAAFGGPGAAGSIYEFASNTGAFVSNFTASTFPQNGGGVTNFSASEFTTLNRPASVVTQPQNSTIIAGANTTFSAATSGGFPAVNSIQWQVSENNGAFADITDGGIYSGAITATLQITAVAATSNGNRYRAVFNNTANLPAVTTAATLTVTRLADIYVDASFNGTAYAANPSTAPTGFTLQYGVNAFADIQSGLNNVATNGTLTLYAHTAPYAGFTMLSAPSSFVVTPNPQNLTGSTLAVINSAVTLTNPFNLDLDGADLNVAGVISDSGGPQALTKTGSGKLALLAANIFSGQTLINAGTLTGTGSVAGDTTLTAEAVIAPGNGGIGTFSIGHDFTWNGSTTGAATASYDLSGTNTTADKLTIGNALLRGTGSTYKFDFGGSGKSAEYVLATFANTTFTASNFSAVNAPGGRVAKFKLSATDLRVVLDFPPDITSAAIAPSTPKTGDVVTFTPTATDADGTALSFVINYGDGTTNSTLSHAYTSPGTYIWTIVCSDGELQDTLSGTVTINNAPPVVTSDLSFTPSNPKTFEAVTFSIAATDIEHDPITVAYDYGDGSSGAANTHVYNSPGVYTVKATVTAGALSEQSVTFTVLPRDPLDYDGDGFSDALEVLAGSDPKSSASTPNAISPGAEQTFTRVKSLAISLRFKGRNDRDTIELNATISDAKSVRDDGTTVVVDVGGNTAAFTLKRGADRVGRNFIRVLSNGELAIVLSGTLAAQLADEGLTNDASLKKADRTIPYALVIGGRYFSGSQTVNYSVSRAGVGTARN